MTSLNMIIVMVHLGSIDSWQQER